MDLFERYLDAIAQELPEAQRADITAELRDVLMTRIEEKEAELGRVLTPKELEALLADYGHPLAVAGRYRKTQHLIGPQMYPFWWKGLKVSLGWVAGVYLVLILLSIMAGRETLGFLDRIPSLSFALVFTFGIVTIGAALIERYGSPKLVARWRPHDLPPVGGRLMRQRSPFEHAVEIGMSVIFLLWWTGAISFRSVVPWWFDLQLASVWDAYHAPVVAFSLLDIAANTMALVAPGARRLNAGLMAAKFAAGSAILVGVLQWDRLVILGDRIVRGSSLPDAQASVDLGLRIGLSVTAVVMLVFAVLHAWRLVRPASGRVAAYAL